MSIGNECDEKHTSRSAVRKSPYLIVDPTDIHICVIPNELRTSRTCCEVPVLPVVVPIVVYLTKGRSADYELGRRSSKPKATSDDGLLSIIIEYFFVYGLGDCRTLS